MANIKARVGNQNVVKVLSNAPAGIQRLINLKDVDDTFKTRDGSFLVWNFPNSHFIMTSVIDNTVSISDTTSSTSSTTGALTVAGGIGVGGDLEVGGNIKAIGIVTFGSGTITIDGDNDIIQVGTGVTLDGDAGVFTPSMEISGPIAADTLNIAGVSTLARNGGITTTGGDLFVGNNLHVSNNLHVAGISTFIGNAVFKGGTIGIGDSNSDDINVQGEFISALIPNDSALYDIGSSAKRWRNAWFSGSGAFTSLLTVGSFSTPGISTAETFSGYTNLQAIHSNTTKEFDVAVGTKTADHRYGAGGNGYIIDGIESPALTLNAGTTYRFNLSEGDQTSHPFRFYLDAAKTLPYSTNVSTASTYTEITITDETPSVLHYQCSAHPLMGNQLQVVTGKVVTPYDAVFHDNVEVAGTLEAGLIDGGTY